jgi:adenylylsulfate kinase-like enzyme
VEQYTNKSASMDMVVRLKIDEKETLLVALKDQGQRVIVEVKTTNEGMGNFLQSQKEEIARQLEGKNIYANIYVDVQNENREKRDQRDNQKKRSDEENEDFVGFLDAMV